MPQLRDLLRISMTAENLYYRISGDYMEQQKGNDGHKKNYDDSLYNSANNKAYQFLQPHFPESEA